MSLALASGIKPRNAARAISGPAGKQGSAASVSQDKIRRAKVELDKAEVRALSPNLPSNW
jgi:hypothetical protein